LVCLGEDVVFGASLVAVGAGSVVVVSTDEVVWTTGTGFAGGGGAAGAVVALVAFVSVEPSALPDCTTKSAATRPISNTAPAAAKTSGVVFDFGRVA
jgi:hypothetical protein